MSDTLNLSPRLYALFVASYVPLRQSFCVFVSKPSLHYKKKAVHIRARIPCAIIENKPGTSKARNQTRKVASQTNTLYYQPSAKYPPGKFPLSLEIDFIFNHPISEGIIALLVSLNCLAFALQTLDVGPLMYEAFRSYESNLSIVFLIEYFCRWYGKGLSPRYLLSRAMILDFIAVAPLGFAVADQSEALFVRILRLSRIFRLTSLVMDSESGKEMMENMTVVQLRLANIGLSLFSLLYVSAGLFYQVEKDVNPAVQNFFDAFYFSTITLFTVGFGDITPLTSLGKSSKSLSGNSSLHFAVRTLHAC